MIIYIFTYCIDIRCQNYLLKRAARERTTGGSIAFWGTGSARSEPGSPGTATASVLGSPFKADVTRRTLRH